MPPNDMTSFHIDDPPPYTAQPPESNNPATSSGLTESSIIVALKHHKPVNLWNAQGCHVQQRSGFANLSIPDAILLPNLQCDFDDFLSQVQQRAAQRLSLSATEMKRGGRLAFYPNEASKDGEKTTAKTKVVVEVDSEDWKAVRVLLLQGKGQLAFEVDDVPKGWTTVRAESKTKGEKAEGKRRWGKETEGDRKGTCAVM